MENARQRSIDETSQKAVWLFDCLSVFIVCHDAGSIHFGLAVLKVDGVEDKSIELSQKQKKAQRARNIAIAVILGSLVIVFYVVTLLKFGSQILERAS